MNPKRIVVLSGAGVSAESGIPTFRDSDGLWEQHRVEDVATPAAWMRDADLVNRFYNMRRKHIQEVAPNQAHLLLAALEKNFDVHIITQNIDNLHEQAGATQVIHLHGEILKMECEQDPTDIQEIFGDITPSHRSQKGHRMRPHIVWFGEAVPKIAAAAALVQTADIFVVIGTSLNVYPAAGLVYEVAAGTPIYIIDKRIPAFNGISNVTGIEKPATEGMQALWDLLQAEIG